MNIYIIYIYNIYENTAFVSVYINGDPRSSRCFKIYSKPPTSSIDNKKAYVTNNDGKLR